MSLDGLEPPEAHLAEFDPSQDLMGRHKRMSRTARLLFLLLLSLGAATLLATSGLMAFPATGQAQSLRPVAAASPDIPFDDGEFETEQQLLALANQARRAAGVPPLSVDSGLSRAARIHAQTMLQARQLSHQFRDEPALPQRLASSSRLLLDQEGENVALDYDALHGHEHLMLSPPHRANLLNPAYNVVGLGVVRNGDRLYIVQDFGHALPNYSSNDVKERVALAVEHKRRSFNRGQLAHRVYRAAHFGTRLAPDLRHHDRRVRRDADKDDGASVCHLRSRGSCEPPSAASFSSAISPSATRY